MLPYDGTPTPSHWLETPVTCWLWVAEFVGCCCRIVWPFMWAYKHSCACPGSLWSDFRLPVSGVITCDLPLSMLWWCPMFAMWVECDRWLCLTGVTVLCFQAYSCTVCLWVIPCQINQFFAKFARPDSDFDEIWHTWRLCLKKILWKFSAM